MTTSLLKDLDSALEIKGRAGRVKARFSNIYSYWDELDAWRWMDIPTLDAIIWGSMGQNTDRVTIPRTDIRSVTDTVIAFLSGNSPPKVHVDPMNPLHTGELDLANFNERIGVHLFNELDNTRAYSLLEETVDHAVHRGAMVAKIIWLSPEERGEVRRPAVPDVFSEAFEGEEEILSLDESGGPTGEESSVPDFGGVFDSLFASEPFMEEAAVGEGPIREYISEDGDFPILMDILDPRECYWVLDTQGKVIEFYHEFEITWDVLMATYPEAAEMEQFKNLNKLSQSDMTVRVLDCWDSEHNAILVNDQFLKKPTKHNYGFCPVVVEMVRPKKVRSAAGRKLEPMPFCRTILDPMKWASWAESMTATHLVRVNFLPLIHYGIASDGSSPYTVLTSGPDGDETVEYVAVFPYGEGLDVIPAFDNERFDYPKPPPIVEVLQEFKQQRLRDIQIVTFAEGILSGTIQAEPSGYSVSLQKQAAMARIEPARHSVDRFLSRALRMAFQIGYENWDRDERIPLMLQAVAGLGESEREITRDMLGMVGNVEVTIIPDVRVDRDRESKEMFEALTLGLVSQLTAVDRLQYVKDANAELERIAFEKVANDPSHPMYLQASGALADAYMRKNKLGPYAEGAQQPAQPPQQEQAMQPPPMDPAMMGAAAMGGDPAMMSGAPPMDPAMAQAQPPMGPPMGMGQPPMGPPMGPAGGGGEDIPPELLQQLGGI